MKVKLYQNKGIWTIIALEDPFKGLTLGDAEALGLRRVYLHDDGSATAGEIVSSYGTTLTDVVYGNPKLIREVGVNRTFRPCDLPVRYDEEKKGWFDPSSGERVGYVRFMTIMGHYTYFSDDMPYPNPANSPTPNPALAPLAAEELIIQPENDKCQEIDTRKDGFLAKLLRR